MEKHEQPDKVSSNLTSADNEKVGGFSNKFQKAVKVLLSKEKQYANQFKLHHKIIFAFVVFFSINLLWYGMWEIISRLPIISNPIIALISGAIILIASGFFYENLITSDINKKRYKRKAKEGIETQENLKPKKSK